VVGDVNEKAGIERNAIKNAGGDALFVKLDVSNREQTKQVVKILLQNMAGSMYLSIMRDHPDAL